LHFGRQVVKEVGQKPAPLGCPQSCAFPSGDPAPKLLHFCGGWGSSTQTCALPSGDPAPKLLHFCRGIQHPNLCTSLGGSSPKLLHFCLGDPAPILVHFPRGIQPPYFCISVAGIQHPNLCISLRGSGPDSNTCFSGLTRVQPFYAISIDSAFLAQSNGSKHHYECVALCKDISLQRDRFCARSLASCIPRSSEDRSS